MLGRWDTERLRVHYQIKFFLPLGSGSAWSIAGTVPPPSRGNCVGFPPRADQFPPLYYFISTVYLFLRSTKTSPCQLKTKILPRTTMPSRRRRPVPNPLSTARGHHPLLSEAPIYSGPPLPPRGRRRHEPSPSGRAPFLPERWQPPPFIADFIVPRGRRIARRQR